MSKIYQNRGGTLTLVSDDDNAVHKTGDETIAGTKTFSSTITGSVSGNAGTATQFSSNATVALTGDATGTSAGSKKGWSVPVTLSNSGVTAGSYGPSDNATPAYGATFNVPYITVDAKGRVTAAATKTVKIPASDDKDTKNTAGSTDTSSKIFLIGATSQAANPQTYSHDTAYVGTDGCLYSGGTKVLTAHQSLSNYVTLNSAQTISAVKTFTAKPVLNQVGLDMTVKDTTEGSTTTRTSQVLHANSSNSSYGINFALCSGGNAVIGGGEAGTAQLNALAGNSGEDLYLVADGNIYLKPNGNTWANAKTITLNNAAELSGLSKVTSTSFVGSLTGEASAVSGTAGTSALSWNTETTLYTVGGHAIKAKLPANPNTDTKNTAGSTDSSSKLFLIGATSQAANPQTYSHDTAYVGTDGCLYSGGTKVLTAHQSLSNYLTKLTNVSEMGRYIDLHYDNDTAAYDYDARIFVNTQGDAAGKGELKITASKVTAGTFNGSLTGNASSASKVSATPAGTTYVAAVTAGNANVTSTATGFGAVWNAPTKNYRVGMATYPSSDDRVLWYSVTNANVSAGTNTVNKSMSWDGGTGILTANGFSGPLTGNVTGNCSGTSANVTGTVAIANGGTGATTRLNAVKNLTNENVGTSATYFLTITNSWGKAGYTSVADSRTVLAMKGATSSANGTAGVVPTPPTSGYNTKYLRADGTWQVPPNTVYTHPTTSGNKHIPSGGKSGQILRWSADGTATWGADNNTTYSAATTSANGLMTAAMVTKLNGIATSAGKYTLVATWSGDGAKSLTGCTAGQLVLMLHGGKTSKSMGPSVMLSITSGAKTNTDGCTGFNIGCWGTESPDMGGGITNIVAVVMTGTTLGAYLNWATDDGDQIYVYR